MKNKSSFIIIIVLLFIVGLSFSYVSYSLKNNQSNTSREYSKWDVEITNIEITTIGESEDNGYTYKEDTLVIKPIIKTIEDSILYRVTIKNKGSIPAKLGRYLYNEKNSERHLTFKHNIPKEELAPGEETIVELVVYPTDEIFEEGATYTNEYTAIYEYIQKK